MWGSEFHGSGGFARLQDSTAFRKSPQGIPISLPPPCTCRAHRRISLPVAAATILSCSAGAPPSTRAVRAKRSMGQSRRGLENASCQPEASFSLWDWETSETPPQSHPTHRGRASRMPTPTLSTCNRRGSGYRLQQSSCGDHTPGGPSLAPPVGLGGKRGEPEQGHRGPLALTS